MIPNWNTYFMNLIGPISSRSKDPNSKFGCVIVGPDNGIRATGFNSFPRGIDDTAPERLLRPEKYKWIEHCERNAIFEAAKIGVPLDGCRIYLYGIPCIDCARAIIQVGIKEVIYSLEKQLAWEQTGTMYKDDNNRVRRMLCEAGVKLSPISYE